MSKVELTPRLEEAEQRLDLGGIGWDRYVTISDALPERRGVRLAYLDGSLTFLTLSRRHDWFVDQLDTIVKVVALACDISLDVAGSATLRREDRGAGVEGDRTYYLGASAELMGGPIDIDLTTQPPPDLAIEVEVTHPADKVMRIYARLGIPEVWRIDAGRETVGFWVLDEGGAYQPAARSRGLPILGPEDVLAQLYLADEFRSFNRWHAQLTQWVRDVILPRIGREP